MRILLHTGKGGVGKTTVSATTAIAAARRGYRTLVLSTDPAHSLADVLGIPIGPDPDEVPGVPGLFAAQVDTRIRLEQAWSAIRQYLVGVLAARGMAEVQAEELTELPGAEEVLALLEVRRHAESGRFDAIVVDCAPSGETLRLLALPETVAFYVGRLMATPRRVLRSVAASLVGAGGVMPNGEVRDAVGDLLAELTAARTLLCDPQTSSVRLVLTPERVVLAEARRLHTALTLHGYAVDGVVVNRVLPRDAGGRFLAGWRTAQRVVLHDISESFGAATVHRIPMTSVEPVGIVELAALADGVFATTDPLARAVAVPAMSVAVAGEGYRLLLPLPHVERSEIELARSGDDLVITLGSVRRRIALPSVLRRCSVIGAELAGEELGIDFRPDPARWPAALTQDGAPRVAVGGAR
ncbi:MAG TPA: ArsA family ATPase [Nakamurella sp.]